MTTLRLHDLDPSQQAVLSQLLHDPADSSSALKEQLAALKAKLEHYMSSNKFSCVRVDLPDGTKYLRYISQRSPRKLTLEAVQTALLAVTEDDVALASARKRKDKSFAAVLADLVFQHIRQHHFGEYFTLSVDDSCQRNVVPHHASPKTADVVQQWLDTKAALAQQPPKKKVSVEEKQALVDYFEKTPDLGNERTFQMGGKQLLIRRNTRTRSSRPPITKVRCRLQWQLQRYKSLPDVRQHSSQLAESLLSWIEEEQERSRVTLDDVKVVKGK